MTSSPPQVRRLFCGPWGGGVQGLSGRGRPSHHRRRPTGRRLARKKRGILGPAEKRAPSPNGSTHARRPISVATYITVAACAARRTAAPAITTDNNYYYYYRRRRSPDNCRRTRAPTCRPVIVVPRRPPSSRRTHAHTPPLPLRNGPERKGLSDRRTLFSRWTTRNSSGCRVNRNRSPSTLLRVHRYSCRRRGLTDFFRFYVYMTIFCIVRFRDLFCL